MWFIRRCGRIYYYLVLVSVCVCVALVGITHFNVNFNANLKLFLRIIINKYPTVHQLVKTIWYICVFITHFKTFHCQTSPQVEGLKRSLTFLTSVLFAVVNKFWLISSIRLQLCDNTFFHRQKQRLQKLLQLTPDTPNYRHLT
jgi:hypothetical protein